MICLSQHRNFMHLHEFVQYLLLPFYAEFSWDEVKVDKHRENYIGHSLKAPVGRWQKGKWSLHFFLFPFACLCCAYLLVGVQSYWLRGYFPVVKLSNFSLFGCHHGTIPELQTMSNNIIML